MPKILVADDSNMMLQIAKMNLEKAGHSVIPASDGNEAVQKAQSEKPDLILLDAEMPEMDGWEAAETISKNPQTASIPILMCTGHDLADEQEELKRVGAKGFITKPYQTVQMLEKIKQVLSP